MDFQGTKRILLYGIRWLDLKLKYNFYFTLNVLLKLWNSDYLKEERLQVFGC